MKLEQRIEILEYFIEAHFNKHYECDDSYYSCPKSPDYFGDYTEVPIENRPCTCGYDDAMKLLGVPEWKDPQLQAESDNLEMPIGDW